MCTSTEREFVVFRAQTAQTMAIRKSTLLIPKPGAWFIARI